MQIKLKKYKFFDMEPVFFKEDGHVYTYKEENYESVSGLWKPFITPFKPIEVSIKKAYKELDPEVYEDSKKIVSYDSENFIDFIKEKSEVPFSEIQALAQSYRDTWSNKTLTGTKFHEKEELQDLERGFRINPFTGKECKVVKWEVDSKYSNQSYAGDMYKDIPDGYIPELLCCNHDVKVAGQADQAYLETIDGKRYVDIDDWKTDGEIVIKPKFFNRKKGGFQKLLYPFDHIYDTNHWKYALKISTYAKMLENLGFIVRNLAFTHVVVDEDTLEIKESKRYILPYKSWEVELAMEYRRKNLQG